MDDNPPSLHDREFIKRLSSLGESGADDASADREDVPSLRLAAWIEHRLPEEEAAAVELALAHQPHLLGDILLLSRNIGEDAPVSSALSQRLMALVPSPPTDVATVIPFVTRGPEPSKRPATLWLSWCAIAASVAVISLVGFDLGTFMGKQTIAQTAASDYLQVPNDDVD